MAGWRLITTWGAPPEFNMGLDEALLLSTAAPPTLRFYSWNPDTLSLGYFQRYGDVKGVEKAGAVVRRITGGGAIHHVRELTFSLTTELEDPLYAGGLRESYARVHRAIASGLRVFGVEAELRGDAGVVSDVQGSGMCFHKSVAVDLVWRGKKGVGSAQRRKLGRVLHHGSIKLGGSELEGDVATVGEVAGGVEVARVARELVKAFERELGMVVEIGVPTVAERGLARELGGRYSEEGWVRRR